MSDDPDRIRNFDDEDISTTQSRVPVQWLADRTMRVPIHGILRLHVLECKRFQYDDVDRGKTHFLFDDLRWPKLTVACSIPYQPSFRMCP